MIKIKKRDTSYHVVPKDETRNSDLLLPTDAPDGVTNYDEFGKIYLFGERTSGFQYGGTLQDYAKLQDYHVKNRTLFVDENFSPESIALPQIKRDIVWKRPTEIVSDPQFIVDGVSRFDINQGALGDCWFLASVANLTTNKKLFDMVVPEDQTFGANYAGIFHFRFWQYGRWVDIVIDDRLPTTFNQLIFMRSSNTREFWPSLLEKAYAKLYGSYANIEGGQISEGLEDLCGGLSESYSANRPELFNIMMMSYERSSFMGCSIISTEMEGRRTDGLITSHAYSITGITKIRVGESDVRLVRLRNPWGNSDEWNGNWSDNSPSWNQLPQELTNKLRHQKPDGEFWMDFTDFQKCFTYVDIVHLNPSSFFYDDDKKNWHVSMFEGSWVPNVTAGGGLKYKDTFCNNPQYHLTIRGNTSEAAYEVVIGLMQKDRRSLGEDQLSLELDIFRIQSTAGTLLDKSFFGNQKPVVSRLDGGVRQLTVRVLLPVGRYCIIPSTWQPNIYASYLLRIYSEVDAKVVENDDEVGYSSDVIIKPPRENKVTELFKTVSQDNSGVGWYGVKKALNKQFGTKRVFCFTKPKISFSKDTCKNILALWDTNYSGKLDSQEFQHLVENIAAIHSVFQQFDKDRSGSLDGYELRDLLTACGYKVNRQILTIIMLRYGYNGTVNFENFVVCTLKLKTMIDEFQRRKTLKGDDQINVNRRDWLQTILYS